MNDRLLHRKKTTLPPSQTNTGNRDTWTSTHSSQPDQVQVPAVHHDFSQIPLSREADLTVSQPGDPAEQEADRVADMIMSHDPTCSDQVAIAPGVDTISRAIPAIYRDPGSPTNASPIPATNPTNSSGTEPSWREMGNLLGKPPVRSETDPPNKNVVEDEAVYNQRRELAEAALKRQQDRAASLLDERGNVKDYRYWFARVYSYVTEGELEFAKSCTFYYPSYVMASVAYFEQIYQDNFNAFNDEGPVEDHWRQAFEEAARQKEFTDALYEQMMSGHDEGGAALAAVMQSVMGAVRSLIVSMQAHIRFDLPRAEAWVFNSYYSQFGASLSDFRADFMSMSGIFDNAGRRMNEDMAQKLGVPVDLIPQLMQDTSMRLFDADMATERADTWQRAEELIASGQAGADPYTLQNGTLEGNVTQGDHLSGLQNLPNQDLRPTIEHSAPVYDDDAVCDRVLQMQPGDIAALPATTRIRMLRGLFRGATVGSDETAVLRILKASIQAGDVVTIIDGADPWDLMYALDGVEFTQLRTLFRETYYGKTSQENALRLLRKCLDGETAEWEEEMVVDVLQYQPNGHALVERIGQIYDGPATGEDAHFKNGLYKLEWQLDGAEEERLHDLFGESDISWWNF